MHCIRKLNHRRTIMLCVTFLLLIGVLTTMSSVEESKMDMNIVFIKPHKVGGSTAGGVFRRIAFKYNLSGSDDKLWIQSEPGMWGNHGDRKLMNRKIKHLKKPTFIITWVRKPINRCVSWFFHRRMTRDRGTFSSQKLAAFVKTWCTSITKEIASNPRDSATTIYNSYDFIGLTERFSESMLVLAYRLDLNLGDILYVRAKDSHELEYDKAGRQWVPNAGFEALPYESQKLLLKMNQSSRIDNNIWSHVNQQLSNVIAGLPCFHDNLREYKHLLGLVSEKCPHQDDCYWADNGCGASCMDEIWDTNKKTHSLRTCNKV